MSLQKARARRNVSLKLGLVNFVLFFSPLAYVDPIHCNMAHLFVELLKDSLNEYAYAAEIAGVNYKLENTMYGIYVSDCLSILTEAEGCQICCSSFPELTCLLVSKRHLGCGNEIGVVQCLR